MAEFRIPRRKPTCARWRKKRDILAVIRGDHIAVLANQGVGRAKAQLVIRYDIKLSATLGPQSSGGRSVRILNRVVVWKPDGLKHEAGQIHAEHIIKKLDLCGARPMGARNNRQATRRRRRE